MTASLLNAPPHWTPPSGYSHRLSRGLRRNLFQLIADGEPDRERVMGAIRQVASIRAKGREQTALLRRACVRLEKNLFSPGKSVEEQGMTYEGFDLRNAEIDYGDDNPEAQIVVGHILFNIQPTGMHATRSVLAFISQHAIERLFQRTGQTSVGQALAQIEDALEWFSLLHANSARYADGKRIRQLLVPTAGGAFLCKRDPGNGLISVRSWVTIGPNTRIDRTRATLIAWRATSHIDGGTTFQRLMMQPENGWMLHAHQPN